MVYICFFMKKKLFWKPCKGREETALCRGGRGKGQWSKFVSLRKTKINIPFSVWMEEQNNKIYKEEQERMK